MSSAFDPYYQWLGIPPHEQPPDHYRLLGLAGGEANADVIESAADRQMAHVRTHQSGKHGEASQKLLNEIAAARFCLLSPEKKTVYDARLRAEGASAAQEKPLKQSKPPARTAAGSGIGGAPISAKSVDVSLRQESPPTGAGGESLAPLVVVLAGGVVVLLLLLVVGGGLMWLLLDSEDDQPPITASVVVDPPPPPVVHREPVVVNPPGPPQPRFPGPSGPPPVILNPGGPPPIVQNPSGPPPSRFPGPTAPAPVIVNPSGPPDKVGPSDPEPVAPVDPPVEAAVVSFFPPEPEDKRLPIPDEADRQERRAQIEELFEIGKAIRFEDKVALAKQLLKTGRETKNDSAARYALLNMAREVAAGAGDVRGALAAAKDLDALYQVEGVEVRLESVSQAAQAAVPAAERAAIVLDGGKLVDQLFQQDRYVEAAKLITLLQGVARKNRDPQQSAALAAQQQLGSELYRAYREAGDSIEKLKADPTDTAAATAAGKYFTFAKGDWQLGLPMLAAGDDESLAKLAELEMAAPTDADARQQLADAWRQSARNFKGVEADRQKARAAMWYKHVVGSRVGLAKIEVQKAIDEIGPPAVDGGQPYRAPPRVATRVPPPRRDPPPDQPAPTTGDAVVAIDLLPLIDLEKNAVLGTWRMDGDALITPRIADAARLEIPFHPPQEYDLEVEATRIDAGNDLAIGLIYQGKPCQIAIDRYRQSATDLQVGYAQNGQVVKVSRRVREALPVGKRMNIKCVVRKDQLQLFIDDKELLNFRGDADWVGLDERWVIPDKQALMLGAWWSEFQVHSIKLTPLGAENSAAVFTVGAPAEKLAAMPWSDGPLQVAQVAGQPAIRAKDRYVYFRVEDDFAHNIAETSNERLFVVATVLDEKPGLLNVQYDAHTDVWRTSTSRELPGSGKWVNVLFELPGARLANRQNGSADFRVTSGDDNKIVLHKIALYRLAQPDSSSALPAPSGEPVDLLKLIELDTHVVEGKWEIRGTTLFTAREEHGRVTIPYEPPESYRVELSARQALGTGPIVIGLVMQGRQFAVEVGQRSGRIYSIDGKPLVGPTGEFLKLGRPSKIVCDVKPGELAVTCDEQEVIHFRGEATRLSLPPEWKVPGEKTLFIGSSRCLLHVPSITLTPLEE